MQLDHINIVTPDVPGTVAFFAETLGLKEGFRPNFAFPGAWLYGDGDTPAIVHIVGDEPAAGGTGPLDHVAFRAEDLAALTDRLDRYGIDYARRVIPGTRARQVFFTAPFGLKIEVNFPPERT